MFCRRHFLASKHSYLNLCWLRLALAPLNFVCPDKRRIESAGGARLSTTSKRARLAAVSLSLVSPIPLSPSDSFSCRASTTTGPNAPPKRAIYNRIHSQCLKFENLYPCIQHRSASSPELSSVKSVSFESVVIQPRICIAKNLYISGMRRKCSVVCACLNTGCYRLLAD